MLTVERVTSGMIAGGIASVLIGIGWGVAPSVDKYIWPDSTFFDVRSVKVLDAFDGQDPVMLVDSAVKASFPGKFVVKVHNLNDVAVPGCHVRHEWEYTPRDKKLTVNLLEWWMLGKVPKCRLRPGRYRVVTVWTISPPSHSKRKIISRSNAFRVWGWP